MCTFAPCDGQLTHYIQPREISAGAGGGGRDQYVAMTWHQRQRRRKAQTSTALLRFLRFLISFFCGTLHITIADSGLHDSIVYQQVMKALATQLEVIICQLRLGVGRVPRGSCPNVTNRAIAYAKARALIPSCLDVILIGVRR